MVLTKQKLRFEKQEEKIENWKLKKEKHLDLYEEWDEYICEQKHRKKQWFFGIGNDQPATYFSSDQRQSIQETLYKHP